MSFDVNWNPEKYREEHESDEHWELRKAFMVRWKNDYPEERLVCLARVFTNMEFMGCRYPPEIMHEVAGLSHEVAQSYRNSRKTKLQRTFVSASTAAEDRAKGVKREGGVITNSPPTKSAKIDFVPQGQIIEEPEVVDTDEVVHNDMPTNDLKSDSSECKIEQEKSSSELVDKTNEYLDDLMKIKCLQIRQFTDRMFTTEYGRMVLLVRPWASKLWNIQTSCQVCSVSLQTKYNDGWFSLCINGILVAQAKGSKAEAKSIVEMLAWDRLKREIITVLVKEQWIAQNGSRISTDDITQPTKQNDFGAPVDSSVAAKMMKLMGWKGGGLGADAQGIAEPIQPQMQMVNRSGLGSATQDMNSFRRAATELMSRYIASDTLDVDLVFSGEFSKEERALLHQCAQKARLASRSYGDKDRFLVVKKKLNPFSLVRAIVDKGGVTPKYQVFLPAALLGNRR
ncbi:hypothetical protein evm_001760 [Chilo suppressalis]|nr:hypothetical protein evm_001760 [Chilo suppressalis]